MKRFFWYPIAVSLLMAPVALAATAEQRFAEAQATFDAAQKQLAGPAGDTVEVRRAFHDAAAAFAEIAGEGVASVNLYINTGNAYHFAGDNARALLWYLRAEKLSNTAATRAGLASLRRACNAEQRPPERTSIGRVLMFWHYDFSRRTKQILALTFYPAGCLLMLIGLLTRRRRVWIRLGVALMVLGGTLGVSDLTTAWSPAKPWGVIVESTEGRAGNGAGYSVVVPAIVPGQELRILESRENWTSVELPSGPQCWVPADSCEPV
jgi:hypothetical protein